MSDDNTWAGRVGRVVGAGLTAALAAVAGFGAWAMRTGRGVAHEAAPAVRAAAEPAASAERQALRSAVPAIERQAVQHGVATASRAEANGLFQLGRSDATAAAPAIVARSSTFVATSSLATASTELGKRVLALRTRVPAAVFQALMRRWQQNDADLRAAASSPASPTHAARVDQMVSEQKVIEEEVRRLEAQFG